LLVLISLVGIVGALILIIVGCTRPKGKKKLAYFIAAPVVLVMFNLPMVHIAIMPFVWSSSPFTELPQIERNDE